MLNTQSQIKTFGLTGTIVERSKKDFTSKLFASQKHPFHILGPSAFPIATGLLLFCWLAPQVFYLHDLQLPILNNSLLALMLFFISVVLFVIVRTYKRTIGLNRVITLPTVFEHVPFYDCLFADSVPYDSSFAFAVFFCIAVGLWFAWRCLYYSLNVEWISGDFLPVALLFLTTLFLLCAEYSLNDIFKSKYLLLWFTILAALQVFVWILAYRKGAGFYTTVPRSVIVWVSTHTSNRTFCIFKDFTSKLNFFVFLFLPDLLLLLSFLRFAYVKFLP
jgi:hypothetical protein